MYGIIGNVYAQWVANSNAPADVVQSIQHIVILMGIFYFVLNVFPIFRLPFDGTTQWPLVFALISAVVIFLVSVYGILLVFFVAPWGKRFTPGVVLTVHYSFCFDFIVVYFINYVLWHLSFFCCAFIFDIFFYFFRQRYFVF